jgi:hypothetical protein
VPPGIEAAYLFTSTDNAWSMREPFFTNPEIPYLMERDIFITSGRKILGASLSGAFPSWFADRPKPVPFDGMELFDMPPRARPTRIIVVGETEFATLFVNVTGGHNNFMFLVNAINWLFDDDDIITISNRVGSAGRLDRIIDPGRHIFTMRLVQFINVVLVPLLVVFAGIFLALRRRAKARLRTGETDGVPTGEGA